MLRIREYFVFLLMLFSIGDNLYSQVNNSNSINARRDTTIVGKLLDCDSIFTPLNTSRAGTRYYYGVHHLKVGVINIESKKIVDTLIIAYVYNMFSDHAMYLKNFKLKKGGRYIFDICDFSPCQSDFPRIQGYCDENEMFVPISNKLIKKYKHLYRVINSYQYLPEQ